MDEIARDGVLISVCVCTYQRPDLLAALLASLAKQRISARFEVVVVDNDPAQSAATTVNMMGATHPDLRIHYACESARGISHARNRAVAMAKGDLIAWIDDDEVAVEEWLSRSLQLLEQLSVDAVFGPVLPVFPPGSHDWCARSGLYDRLRFTTGTLIDASQARTGNTLMRAHWLHAGPAPFDPSLALTGGEDADFFARIEARGARFAWCDEAVVSETVPIARQSLRWLLERRLRASANYWRQARHSFVTRIVQALFGIGAFGVYALAGMLASPFGTHRIARLWSVAAAGLGRAVALTPLRWNGY